VTGKVKREVPLPSQEQKKGAVQYALYVCTYLIDLAWMKLGMELRRNATWMWWDYVSVVSRQIRPRFNELSRKRGPFTFKIRESDINAVRGDYHPGIPVYPQRAEDWRILHLYTRLIFILHHTGPHSTKSPTGHANPPSGL
jgi:hypothetical protein